jgi:hypothetical protein
MKALIKTDDKSSISLNTSIGHQLMPAFDCVFLTTTLSTFNDKCRRNLMPTISSVLYFLNHSMIYLKYQSYSL